MSPLIRKTLKLLSLIFVVIVIVSISLAYLYYRDLKKTFISKLSDKTTAFIGQKVDIGDLSFSPKAGMNLYTIVIENPEGFEPGQFLKIKRLYLKMKFGDLLRERFHFQNVTVDSPELTLMADKSGRLNISDKLREFFKRKPTISYQVDEFSIESGIIDFNKDKKYRNDNITVHIKNLSSSPGTKTLIDATTSYSGQSRVIMEGWAYLKDDPKKFSVSVSTGDIPLSAFEKELDRYKVNAGKTKVKIGLDLEGDTVKGVNCRSILQIKDAESRFLNKKIRHAQLSMDAFFDMDVSSILVKDLSLNSGNNLSVQSKASITNIRKNPAYDAELTIKKLDLSAFNFMKGLTAGGIVTSDAIDLKGGFNKALPEISGSFFVRGAALTRDNRRNILKNASLNLKVTGDGRNFGFMADAGAGKLSAKFSGAIKKAIEKNRSVTIKVALPETNANDIRNSFWDIFPDSLLYGGLEGSISSDFSVGYTVNDVKVNGEVRINNILLRGENGEYSAGPVKGVIPISYDKAAGSQKTSALPSFELSSFDDLGKYYAREKADVGYSRVTIGSLNYGFKFLDDINVWIKQTGTSFNLEHFSGNIFGGRINGSAIVDISKGLEYKAGFILEGLSLTKLCDSIEPIKGYISGKVNGIANLKGSGGGISHLIGKADFWTYGTDDEKMKISKQFLQKIGGPSMKTYLGDRRFDKGVISLYLQDGYVIFRELEISNRNFFGIQDLSVKVVPFNNKIAIDNLMWSITEAAARAQKKE